MTGASMEQSIWVSRGGGPFTMTLQALYEAYVAGTDRKSTRLNSSHS